MKNFSRELEQQLLSSTSSIRRSCVRFGGIGPSRAAKTLEKATLISRQVSPTLSSGYENIRIVAEKLFHSRASATEVDSISHCLADETSVIRTFNRKLSHLHQNRSSQSEHSRTVFKGSFISKNSYCILSIVHFSISRVLIILCADQKASFIK
jgi:hypothetical protein